MFPYPIFDTIKGTEGVFRLLLSLCISASLSGDAFSQWLYLSKVCLWLVTKKSKAGKSVDFLFRAFYAYCHSPLTCNQREGTKPHNPDTRSHDWVCQWRPRHLETKIQQREVSLMTRLGYNGITLIHDSLFLIWDDY